MSKVILSNNGMKITVDNEDAQRVGGVTWTAKRNRNTWYAASKINGKTIYLHRLITRAPKGKEVDHIDGDGLNCRRSNLRICSHRENLRNSRLYSSNKSGYRGVSWHSARNKWRAFICIEEDGRKRQMLVGSFSSAIEAARAYDRASKLYFGEFARLNFK